MAFREALRALCGAFETDTEGEHDCVSAKFAVECKGFKQRFICQALATGDVNDDECCVFEDFLFFNSDDS